MNYLAKLLILFLIPLASFAQKDGPVANWQNLDLERDGVFGVSTERAYTELLKGRPSKPVVVAVIDGGIDYTHEDLKDVMWINQKEKSNKLDDDRNGYVDDIYGWNFIGSEKGNVRYDNTEVVRLIRKYQDKYVSVINSTPLSPAERQEFNLYKKLVKDFSSKQQEARMGYENLSLIKRTVLEIVGRMGLKDPKYADFDKFKAKTMLETKVIGVVKGELWKKNDFTTFMEELNDALRHYHTQLNYHYNMDFNSRDTVGDNYNDQHERLYGNADVKGPDADHGTHVAGIIGANRKNNIGIKGVADNVKIMAIRVVPDGDERDKDVANAIRYAVDNGARIVNMSFGKAYSWDKSVVDSAVKYAARKNVLLVHAAGNDSKNTDEQNSFPNKFYADTTDANFWGMNPKVQVSPAKRMERPMYPGYGGMNYPQNAANVKVQPDTIKFTMKQAPNWIEVGASGWKNDVGLVADFSNYGKRVVDVFAPGVKINSTIPESKYKEFDGTSMASPVVSGVAALIMSYYPHLTAVQVKEIIMRSVVKVDQKVKVRNSADGSTNRTYLTNLSVTGGVVNAYNALKLAATYK